MKSIVIQAKEWRDKKYGNSYFSAQIYIHTKDGKQENLYIPFGYGYRNSYEGAALIAVQNKYNIKELDNTHLSLWARLNKIHFHSNINEKCLKREVKAWGKE